MQTSTDNNLNTKTALWATTKLFVKYGSISDHTSLKFGWSATISGVIPVNSILKRSKCASGSTRKYLVVTTPSPSTLITPIELILYFDN